MKPPTFQMRQCANPTCRFRFPVDLAALQQPGSRPDRCPLCGSPVQIMVDTYTNPKVMPTAAPEGLPEVEALLDNIRSTFNVGAMFRTADGAGLRHLHLAGITPTPDHPKIAKTALGAERAVPWTAHRNGLDAALALRDQGYHLWALEGGPGAVSLFEAARGMPEAPVLLVVGNEIAGVDPALLDQVEKVVSIPMQGAKHSLNVAIAFGIAAYVLRYGKISF
jgi:23S rRNA (guanosine2251-2'-O)-methyltransferase